MRITVLFAALCIVTVAGNNGVANTVADTVTDASRVIEITSADSKTAVVELYTSEGCSSCPPADEYLRKLGASIAADFNAVPLAFHVDYWNYLGWPDPYSKPAFTARQRQAAANNRRRSIYTPAFFVDGVEARAGRQIIRAIEAANATPAEARIDVRIVRIAGDGAGSVGVGAGSAGVGGAGDGVSADGAGAGNGDSDNADIIRAHIDIDNRAIAGAHYQAHVAVYESGIARRIGAGENRGRTLKHDFVVRHWSAPFFIRQGKNQTQVEVVIPPDWHRPNLGLAVIIQNRRTFATLQSIRTPLARLFSG